LNLSIANSAWMPCSLHLSLFLAKTTLKLKKMENGEWNEVGLGLDTCPLKDKIAAKLKKSCKKLKAAKKNRKLGAGAARPASDTMGRGGSYPARSSAFLNVAFWCMSSPCALPQIIRIGPIGPHLTNLLNMVWAQLIHFLLTLGSICINLQSKPQTSQNKHNRRNRGANHKIKHINGLKMSPKHPLNPCKYDTHHSPCLNFCLSSSKILYKTD